MFQSEGNDKDVLRNSFSELATSAHSKTATSCKVFVLLLITYPDGREALPWLTEAERRERKAKIRGGTII